MLDRHSIKLWFTIISRGDGGSTARLGNCIEAWQDSASEVDESLCIHVSVQTFSVRDIVEVLYLRATNKQSQMNL